jgi:two-component system NtrC family response regulator
MTRGSFRHTAEESAGLRLLVVDDEFLIRWAIKEALSMAGHTVAEASSREEALELLSSGPAPHVVLLDLRLPDSSDLGLLETIRRTTPTSAVIMMTAYGSPEIAADAMRLGAFRVLGKPVELGSLAPLVRQAYAAHSPLRA